MLFCSIRILYTIKYGPIENSFHFINPDRNVSLLDFLECHYWHPSRCDSAELLRLIVIRRYLLFLLFCLHLGSEWITLCFFGTMYASHEP